ncbi:MAG: TRAP transporter large permease [Desulfarculaceae bacterium]|jgi:tripartite ATP-independent transporter DctM subunit
MDPVTLGYIGVGCLFCLVLLGMPIAFASALVGLVGIGILKGWTVAFSLAGYLPHGVTAHYSLSVIPLFIIMGYFAYFAGITGDVFKAARNWVGHFPGGLALATTFGCAGFAACTGASLAAAAVMGKVAIPEMQKYGYDNRLATGSVAAGGTLAVLIPPSIPLVLFGIITDQSIGVLLIAGVIPGILTAIAYSLVIYGQVKLRPNLAPTLHSVSWQRRMGSLKKMWGMLVIFCLIIGGIYSGAFTPTEAGGAGATFAFFLALFMKKINWATLKESVLETGRVTVMIFAIVVGILIFVRFLALTGLPASIATAVVNAPVHPLVILAGSLLIYVILGMFLELIGMMLLTLPVIYPAIVALDFNPIWFGIIVVKMCEICLVTPPVGLNVYAVYSVAPKVPLEDIFRGIAPFLMIDIATIILFIAWPELITFLPSLMVTH